MYSIVFAFFIVIGKVTPSSVDKGSYTLLINSVLKLNVS